MEEITKSEKLLPDLDDANLNQEDLQLLNKINLTQEDIPRLMKIIKRSGRTTQFPKIFINQFMVFVLLGFFITIILYLSNTIAKFFSAIFGLAFFIMSIIIFRIFVTLKRSDLLLQSYQISFSMMAAFSAIIFFRDSIEYGLEVTIGFLLLMAGFIYVLISYTDEICKKLKIVLNERAFDKKSILLAISLPMAVGQNRRLSLLNPNIPIF